MTVIQKVQDEMTVDVTDMANGIYMLRATTTEGDIITEKIIVQH